MKKLFLLALFISLACVTAYGQDCTGSDAIQKHIYHPNRLEPTGKGCITITGKVMFRKFEPDGDVHYRIKVTDKSLVNAKNIGGFLVVEPICMGKVTQADAKPACKKYHQTINLPNKGDTITATGIHVLDKQHGWLELHPVTKIEIK